MVVKLLFTVACLSLRGPAGRRLFPGVLEPNPISFTAALLLGTLSVLTLGFVLASLVRTARFARPLAAKSNFLHDFQGHDSTSCVSHFDPAS